MIEAQIKEDMGKKAKDEEQRDSNVSGEKSKKKRRRSSKNKRWEDKRMTRVEKSKSLKNRWKKRGNDEKTWN